MLFKSSTIIVPKSTIIININLIINIRIIRIHFVSYRLLLLNSLIHITNVIIWVEKLLLYIELLLVEGHRGINPPWKALSLLSLLIIKCYLRPAIWSHGLPYTKLLTIVHWAIAHLRKLQSNMLRKRLVDHWLLLSI